MAVDDAAIASPRELSRMIASKGPAKQVELKLWRDGKSIVANVLLKEQPGQKVAIAKPASAEGKAQLGVMLQDTERGVVIAEVEPNSPAAEKGLLPGEVISQVQGVAVKTADDVQRAIGEASANKKKSVLMLIKGAQGNRFVAIKLRKYVG